MTSFARRLIAVVLIASSLSGCTGYKHIALGAAPPARSVIVSRMEVGQTFRVEMRDGTLQKITVAKIEADALVGEKGERLAFAEMLSAERKGVNVTKTVVMLWLGTGLAIVAAMAITGGTYAP